MGQKSELTKVSALVHVDERLKKIELTIEEYIKITGPKKSLSLHFKNEVLNSRREGISRKKSLFPVVVCVCVSFSTFSGASICLHRENKATHSEISLLLLLSSYYLPAGLAAT